MSLQLTIIFVIVQNGIYGLILFLKFVIPFLLESCIREATICTIYVRLYMMGYNLWGPAYLFGDDRRYIGLLLPV